MERIVKHFVNGFEQATAKRSPERRVGAEMKFPFVDQQGRAGTDAGIQGLWRFLEQQGWRPDCDGASAKVIGACTPGPCNDTMAGCETGFCKTEFALAHVADLHELERMVDELRGLLRRYSEQSGYLFLGSGIQPISPPSKHLEMKKSRNTFWADLFGSNDAIAPEDGDDVHLFTVSASSQVHIDVSLDEAVAAVNAFNGFAGAQIALTGNSTIWRGELDADHKCVGEMFWDWWDPGTGRYGIPLRPFADLPDYVRAIAGLSPVYVRRDGEPLGLPGYHSFFDYYRQAQAEAVDGAGNRVQVRPEPADIDQHGTFYWYNARISRYYTLENRVNDQQPPDDLLCIAALTLGLAEALDASSEELRAHDWDDLRRSRVAACQQGLQGRVDGLALADLAGRLVDVAEQGLKRRGRGEQEYLAPLRQRLRSGRNPADEARAVYERGGIPALLEAQRI